MIFQSGKETRALRGMKRNEAATKAKSRQPINRANKELQAALKRRRAVAKCGVRQTIEIGPSLFIQRDSFRHDGAGDGANQRTERE